VLFIFTYLSKEGSTESLTFFAQLLVEGTASFSLSNSGSLISRLASSEDSMSSLDDRIRIQFLHGLSMAERIDLSSRLADGLLGSQELGNSGVTDDASKIGVGHLGVRQSEARLFRFGLVGTIDGIESSESIRSPDEESTEVSTRSESQQVEGFNIHEFNARDVTEGTEHIGFFLVDDNGTQLLDISTVTEFTSASSDVLRSDNLFDISINVELLEGFDGLLGLVDVSEGFSSDDERNFIELINSVTSGSDQSRDGRSSDSRADSVSLHADVDLTVPSSPGGVRGVHVTATRHVTESGLARSVGTPSSDSGDTGDGAASPPRLGGALVACEVRDGVGLSVVLGHVGVHDGDEVGTDGSAEHSGQVEGLAGGFSSLGTVDGDQRTSSH